MPKLYTGFHKAQVSVDAMTHNAASAHRQSCSLSLLDLAVAQAANAVKEQVRFTVTHDDQPQQHMSKMLGCVIALTWGDLSTEHIMVLSLQCHVEAWHVTSSKSQQCSTTM